ncbi:Protein phosphatase 1 regulatory subunit 7 [Myotis davidii]|uniref:Protein phosphatase 1 regulatory subunit 7 n=1 Tax=Myotis davidii TaxID=225400 RepID=L5LRK3_MYODS|nr:Protein phosphatase 1 regulatory subunit 7 [Myotis davidii]
MNPSSPPPHQLLHPTPWRRMTFTGGHRGQRRTCYSPQSHQTCSEEPLSARLKRQRDRATRFLYARDRNPFSAEEFFRGSSVSHKIVTLGALPPKISEAGLLENPGWVFQDTAGFLEIAGRREKVGTLCSEAEEYCSKRCSTRVPLPPCTYGVSASLKRRLRAGREAEAGGAPGAGGPTSPGMNDNLLESWSDLDELKGAKNLETVYLEGNPLQKDPQYRRKVMLALPSVRQIDATFVRF